MLLCSRCCVYESVRCRGASPKKLSETEKRFFCFCESTNNISDSHLNRLVSKAAHKNQMKIKCASSRHHHACCKQQAASSKQQAASSKQQAASSKQQAASSKQQAASSKQQAASSKQQAASSKHQHQQHVAIPPSTLPT